jgi:hypothetical protein
MGQGFTVRNSVLQAKGEAATSLEEYCQAVARDAVGALNAMAGSAGHSGLASALAGAAVLGDEAFAGMLSAYLHVAEGLAASGRRYASAEEANTSLSRQAGARGPEFPSPYWFR